ncbi:MAG: hybrid sensor histidine kinase/response regulator, partial [Pedosphaera sp.]|nr:hybrid sensor histidine kinase/response regulator [Pedosphaera sp.]
MNGETHNTESFPRRLRILFLEDNARDRELVMERMKADGLLCEFTHAKSGIEFEDALALASYDLIISDFTLPSYHGLAALAAARTRQPDVPFIFVSGTIGEERAVESLKTGATDYVIKGHLERLTPAIRRALREAADRVRRRQAEESLRASEERFRTVFESAPIGVLNADAAGRIMRANRTLQQMLGYTEAELQNFTGMQLTHEEDVERTVNAFEALLAGTTERVRHEKRYRRKDQSFVWVQITATAIRDAKGNFLYTVALVEDLTERKLAEEQMRDQAKLLDMAHDAIVVKDAEGRITSWNRGAVELYGWSAEEVLGRKVTEILYSDPASYETIKKGLLAHGDWSGELHQRTRAGNEVIVNSRATLMCDEKGNPKSILVINTDLTEKKKLELQFLRAQRLESIGTLASGIAHDLNNILAPIAIASQILRMKPMDEEARQMLDRIETSAHRGADVVRQVLTFARGMEGERALLQPRHLLREVIKIAEETFPKSITISYSTADNLWPVMGDATQLHQVLLNLCVNARDAMPLGGKLRFTAENLLIEDGLKLVPGMKAGPYILVQIEDTGTGIPPEIMEKIFEPFFTTKELGKGTGLGLSTVLGIVKSHGGWVNVYSEPGHGTNFKIYIPAVPNAAAPQTSGARASLPRGRGELVLMVDDEPAIRDVTRKILVRHGYIVITASDGVEALALFSEQPDKIQLVLTDMMMPRMEGLALIRAIRKLDANCKIIASSGLANLADQKERNEELKSLGVQEFLPKPCPPEK